MDKLCIEVEPGLLYGRPGPARTQWNLPFMKARGLLVVVSLVTNVDSAQVASAGLIHYSLPFDDKLSTPYATSKQFLVPILNAFDEILDRHLARKEPILVHCNAGNDRTGFLLGYYLLTRKQMKPKKIVRALRNLNANALTANGFEEGFCAMADSLIEQYRQR